MNFNGLDSLRKRLKKISSFSDVPKDIHIGCLLYCDDKEILAEYGADILVYRVVSWDKITACVISSGEITFIGWGSQQLSYDQGDFRISEEE